MKTVRSLPLAIVVALAACASPQSRIRTGLIQQGLSEPLAACVAGRMTDRLSLGQLNRLGTLLKESRDPGGRVSLVQLVERLRLSRDAEIAGVVAEAGLGCAAISG